MRRSLKSVLTATLGSVKYSLTVMRAKLLIYCSQQTAVRLFTERIRSTVGDEKVLGFVFLDIVLKLD